MAGKGEVRFRLVAEVEQVKNALNEVKSQIGALGNELSGRLGPAGSVLSAMGPAGLVAAAGIGASVAAAAAFASELKRVVDTAGQLQDLSAKFGVTTQAIQEMAYAGSLVGVSQDAALAAIGKAQVAIAKGSDTTIAAVEKLGLSLTQLELMAPEEQFATIAAALREIQNPTEQAGLAVAIFGKSFREVMPLIKQDLESTKEEARALGAIWSGELVTAGDTLEDDLTRLSKGFEGLKTELVSSVAQMPEMVGVLSDLVDVMKDLIGIARESGPMIELFFKPFRDNLAMLRLAKSLAGSRMTRDGLTMDTGPMPSVGTPGIARPDTSFGDAMGGVAALALLEDQLKETAKEQDQAAAAAKRHAAELKALNGTIIHEVYELANMGPHLEEANIYNLLEESRKRASQITQGPAENMGYDKLGELLHAIEDQTEDVVEKTTDWQGALDEVANIFQVLGISASSSFGKILGGLSAGMSGLQRAKDIGGIGIIKNESGKTNWGQTFASLGAGMQIVGSAVSIGKAIVGLFKSDPIKKAQKQAGQALGVGISRELAEAISKQSKSLGISVQKAALLNISGAMGESGKDPRSFAGQITSLMQAIKDGSVPAAQGLEELGKSFTAVADAALKAGSVGDAALVGIIKNARAAGIESPEIKAFVSEQLANAAAGVGKMGGLQIVTAQDAESQALIFSTVFWATVKEKGIIGAADAFAESFSGMSEKLKASGFDVSAIFGPIEALMGLAGNDIFRGAADGALGLKEALEGVANAGYLTAQSFAAFGQQAGAAYQQALAGGASDLQALQTISPLLGSIISASRNYGFTIDANTQALIDQAKAAGISFPTEPMERVANLLGLIAEKMGATADEIARATGNMDEFGRSVGDANAEVGTGVGGVPGREGMAGTGGPVGNTTVTINYSPTTNVEGAGNEQTVLQFVTEGLRNNADGLRSLVEGLARGAV